MKTDILNIEYGKIPNVLLLGNGINRSYRFLEWKEFIQSIQTVDLTDAEKEYINQMPCPLQPIIYTNDRIGAKLKEISSKLSEAKAPPSAEKILCTVANLPFDAILTTNYTYELEKALHSDFRCEFGRRCKDRKVAYDGDGEFSRKQLFTYFQGANENQTIWHIHGEAAKPDTMILGHYLYGKLLSAMQRYIAKLERRYQGNASREQDMECHSWIDYFMLGNVYIVGQGMDLSELDLWWLVNCKKRNFPDTHIHLYKPDITVPQRLLAETYGVHVHTDGLHENDYPSYYTDVTTQLQSDMMGVHVINEKVELQVV